MVSSSAPQARICCPGHVPTSARSIENSTSPPQERKATSNQCFITLFARSSSLWMFRSALLLKSPNTTCARALIMNCQNAVNNCSLFFICALVVKMRNAAAKRPNAATSHRIAIDAVTSPENLHRPCNPSASSSHNNLGSLRCEQCVVPASYSDDVCHCLRNDHNPLESHQKSSPPQHPPSDIGRSFITEQQYENGHGLL